MIPWLLATAAARSPAGEVQPSDPHYDLEVLYHQRAFTEGLRRTEDRMREHPEDKDLYWTKARFLFEIAEARPDDPSIDREAHYAQMLATVEAGLGVAPEDPGLRFARGAARARLATTRGVLASLFMADDIEADWQFVATHPTYRYASIGGVQMLPCDAFHALGMFYRLVPDRWMVGVIAGTRGDLDRSLSFHESATACKPHEIKNWKELGVTQLCIGDRRGDLEMIAAGRSSLIHAQSIAARSDKERLDLRHVARLLDDPDSACGYSRDRQQDEAP